MLDECKGDKFMEILVVFSAAVLRKATLARKPTKQHAPIAKRLATAESLPLHDQASLLPLALAHKAALMNVLRKKEEQRAQYRHFALLLETKSEEAVARNEQCGMALEGIENSGKDLPDATAVKKTLHDNWLGNPEWLEVMIHGDQEEAEHGMFQLPFEELLKNIQQHQDVEGEQGRQKSLLQDLEARVNGQEERLSRWKAFHSRMNWDKASRPEESEQAAPPAMSAPGTFNFDKHQDLRIGATKPSRDAAEAERRSSASKLSREYNSILGEMRELLDAANKAQGKRPPPNMPKAKPSASSIPKKPFARPPRTKTQSVREPEPEPKREASPEQAPSSRPALGRPVSPDWFSPLGKSAKETQQESEEPQTSSPREETATGTTDDEQDILDYLSDRAHVSPTSMKEPIGSEEGNEEQGITQPSSHVDPPSSRSPSPIDMEERLAEQIISSIDDATPSPMKRFDFDPRPSLTERTRLTMGDGKSPRKQASLERRSPLPEEVPTPNDPENERRAALLARTMATMSALSERPPAPAPAPSTTKLKSRKSISRSKRQSVYPDKWGDSPLQQDKRRTSTFWDQADEQREVSPAEQLLSLGDQAGTDAASVFKSRPRIALSPTFNGAGDGSGNGDGGEGDGGGDEAFEGISEIGEETLGDVMGDSPSRGR
ncbi:uncharacterized protein K452DRAFT_284618 [Aplosporella prunicola CBS 121167]|uniref:HAUS augmin-like complex subunit 6 N-terminal domain-containing protein n=1 Tax=Aplosporella prunicola CBS 121167 TaxID=1176127 RepID=A0A6A6BP57_9PEZI|nr:uncharacterized protein K452DRAFT_284618 [Aplosporella prunicola CBS 121167]KAF2145223.1 hypothetical protein K452DRAFT_284618 [Aplosporella prunicola CBS 121167]